ncbi:MBL fold metallo-hydrolase [Marinactinospora rubrisoli]|uniref:MBL fold metallo-hydrolase n=1 Tax=Marinactinospora rubrisoli TaxID=2715399 RepID=A0ABW2KJQ5_9ACTN
MSSSVPSPDDRLRRPPGIRSLLIGDIRVTHIPDGEGRLDGRGWLPDVSEEEWSAHSDHLDDAGSLVMGVGGLLVEHAGRVLLIDAGIGPVSISPPVGTVWGGALPDNLAEVGYRPQDVEAVAITHLHHDHIGWTWHPVPGGEPSPFAGAGYLVSAPEWDQRSLTDEQGRKVEAALAPRVRTVADGEEVFPGVTVLLTPGHTPGHTSYVIASGGQRLIVLGDALHSPIQVAHPEWGTAVDHDREQSMAPRRRLIAELARPDTIGYGGHFADVVFGRVEQDGDGPAWHPIAP